MIFSLSALVLSVILVTGKFNRIEFKTIDKV